MFFRFFRGISTLLPGGKSFPVYFRRMLNSGSLIVFCRNEKNQLLYWNNNFTASLGIETTELLKQNVNSFVLPEDWGLLQTRKYLSNSSASLKNVIRLNKKGEEAFWEWEDYPFFRKNHKVFEIWTIAKDISETVKLKSTIKNKEDILGAIDKISSVITGQEKEKDQYTNILHILGNTLKVNRTYLLKTYRKENFSKVMARRVFEWSCHPAFEQIKNPDFYDFNLEELTPGLYGTLLHNHVYKSVKKNFTEEISSIMLQGKVKSVLIVPIVSKGFLIGALGADDCDREREWTDDEVKLLTETGKMISLTAAKKYDEIKKENADNIQAHRINKNYHEAEAGLVMPAFSHEARTHTTYGRNTTVAEKVMYDRNMPEGFVKNAVKQLIETSLHPGNSERPCYDDQNYADYKIIFELNPLPVLIYDSVTLKIIDANNSALKQYSTGREDMLSKSILDIFPEKEQQRFRNNGSKALTGRWTTISEDNHEISVNIHSSSFSLKDKDCILITVSPAEETGIAAKENSNSEERFKALVNASPDMFFINSLDGTYLECYSSNKANFYGGEFFTGKNIKKVLPGNLAELYLDAFNRLTKTNGIEVIEYSIDVRGQAKHFQARITRYNSGGFLSVVKDVTDIVEKTRELKESKDRYKLLSDNSLDLICLHDIDSTFEFISPSVKKMLGYDPEFLIGKKCNDFAHPDDLQFTKIFNDSIYNPGGFEDIIQFRIRTRDGSYIWLETLAKLITDENKPRILTSSRDITLKKIIEQELYENENRLESLVNSIKGSVYIYDIKNKTLMFLSAAAEEIYGRQRQEFFNNPRLFLKVIHKDDIHRILLYIRKMEKSKSGSIEYRIIHRDGSVRWINDRFWYILDSDGLPIRIEGLATDITKLIKAQEEVLQNLDREKELNELKSRFISTTSHEFRTPLSTILSSIEILESYGITMDEARKVHHIHKIKGSIRKLSDMLNDLLVLEKAESGKIPFTPVEENIKRICEEMIEDTRLSVNRSSIVKFEYNISSEYQPVDKKIFISILTNLLINSIKYSPENSPVRFIADETPDNIIFTIEDSGIGIPDNEISHIFDGFFRASNVGNIPGTGLGLPIVKKYVEIHRGSISVQSKQNKGTKFIIIFKKRYTDEDYNGS